jgi:hypothetical protein
MYLWAAVFSGSVVWLSLQRTQQPGGVNHHGRPVLVFVAITAAAVVVLLLMSMPKLRQWGRNARLDEAAATLDGSSSKLAAARVPASLSAAALESAALERAAVQPAAVQPAAVQPAVLESSAAELRPPAAAPAAATGSAEPQLVAAAAVSRMSPLGAPMPNGGSPGRATPTPGWVDRQQIERERAERVATASDWGGSDWGRSDWADSGWTRPEWADPDWSSPDWAGRDDGKSGWPEGSNHVAAEPSDDAVADPRHGDPPASSWTFGDRRRSDHEPTDWQTVDDTVSETARFDPWRSGSHRPAGNGDAAPRSIIGTPPPAVTSLGVNGTAAIESNDVDRGDAGPTEL